MYSFTKYSQQFALRYELFCSYKLSAELFEKICIITMWNDGLSFWWVSTNFIFVKSTKKLNQSSFLMEIKDNYSGYVIQKLIKLFLPCTSSQKFKISCSTYLSKVFMCLTPRVRSILQIRRIVGNLRKLCFNSVPKAGFISFVICKISQKLNQFNFLLQRYQLVSSDTKIEIDYLVIVALGVIDWLIDWFNYLFIYLFICLFIVICLFILCWRKLFYNKFNYTYIKLRYANLSLRCTNNYKIKNIKIYKYPFIILWPSYFSMSSCTNNTPRNHQLKSQWIRVGSSTTAASNGVLRDNNKWLKAFN